VRIEPLEEKKFSLMLKPLAFMMKRQMHKILNPFKALAYRPGIALTMSIFMQAVEASKVTEPQLKRLLCLRSAQMIGCVF
jgi:hypothetical protein